MKVLCTNCAIEFTADYGPTHDCASYVADLAKENAALREAARILIDASLLHVASTAVHEQLSQALNYLIKAEAFAARRN